MLSLQASKEMILPEESLSKKRKWDDQGISDKPGSDKLKPTAEPPILDQNHLRLPLDLQRCLDINSGKVYFYNTRTNQRVDEYNLPPAMSLELQLNSPCQPANSRYMNPNMVVRSPSWLAFEGEQPEMVTAVCRKCYMLVMMSKSLPSCPNCKFVHPLESEPDRTF